MRARRVPSWALVGLPVAIALVIAVVVAGRGARPPATTAGQGDAVRSAAPNPPPAPLSPTGTPEDPPTVAAVRSRDGAAAAALGYLGVLASLVTNDPAGREATLATLAAPGSPDVVAKTLAGLGVLDQAVAGARAALPGARVLVRDVPVSYTVAAYHEARARVEVWSVGVVLIEGRTDATEVWSTNTVELSWSGDGWRVWAWSRAPGPVPAPNTDAPSAPADVLAGVATWQEVGYAPAR